MHTKAIIVFCLIGIAGCSEERPNDPDWLIQYGNSAQKDIFLAQLGNSEDSSKADVLYRFLSDEDPEIVAKASYWIGYLNARDYIPTLIALLEHQDRQVVNMAGGGLAEMVDGRDARYLDRLYPVLEHEFLLARMSAIEVIGNIGNAESTHVLLEMFPDEEPAARWEIVNALGKIGDVRALPALKQFQQEVQLMDHSVPNRGGVRGSDPHPESFDFIVEESIAKIEGGN